MSQQLDSVRLASQAWRDVNRPLVTFGGLDARGMAAAAPLVFIPRWWLLAVVLVLWVGILVAKHLRIPPEMALRRLRIVLTGRRKLLRPWHCKQ